MVALQDVFSVAAEFLSESIVSLEKTHMGAPGRAFVSPGEPALDCCDQLAVWNATLGEGAEVIAGTGALAGRHRLNRGGFPQVTVSILISRCVPVPSERNGKLFLPSPEALQQAAQTIDEDGWALWLGLSASLRHGSLAQLCTGAERLGGTKLTPQGGCGGWLFQYRYPLEGGILA